MEVNETTLELVQLLEENENISMLLETDLVLDIFDEVLAKNEVKVSDELIEAMEVLENTTDFLLLTQINGDFVIEDLFNEDSVIPIIENDVVVYDSALFDDEEILDYIEADTIIEYDFDEEDVEEEGDFVSEYIDEVTEEVVDDLINEECPHCVIGEALEDAFRFGYEMALAELRDGIDELIGQ
ncbi:MAG: hypothetical protein ACRDD7_06225 [Peptostreptococcaceae bacterium]